MTGTAGWQKEAPWTEIKDGHTTYYIRGTGDPESSAIAVKLVSAAPRPASRMPIESALMGLSVSRVLDVVGDGNAFEQRPLYEVEGCLWKKRDPEG